MPLTPYGSPGSPDNLLGLSPKLALFGGGLIAVVGLVLALAQPLDGLMVGSFGLALACWGGLMTHKGPARLLLAAGVLSGLTCFIAAVVQAL
jgi:hypothetical protein